MNLKGTSFGITDVYHCQYNEGKNRHIEDKEKERNNLTDPEEHKRIYPHYFQNKIRTLNKVRISFLQVRSGNIY